LWTAWFTWPLMAVVQMMCAQIGMVTGRGLAGTLAEKFPKSILLTACSGLLIANTINIASDLAGMADAADVLTGVSSHVYVVIFGAGITVAIVRFRYYQIASILKWLVLALFAYVITAFLIQPDWQQIAHVTFAPSLPNSTQAWQMLVAILGTTISPYLYFWQSAQEVEEEKAKGRRMLIEREGATPKELSERAMDVGVGTFLSNIVMFFVILATALTLNAHGVTAISSSKEAAEALRPLAGNLAATLYTIGIVAAGFLAIPTLAGSAAYAFAETMDWSYGLDEKLNHARAFYAVIIMSVLCGVAIDFINVDPIAALFWTAVINGLISPFLLIGVLLVARDERIMLHQPSSLVSQAVVAFTAMVMFGAAIGMFVF
jgi:Mn2+/Fe2+ NRAMP family transporter